MGRRSHEQDQAQERAIPWKDPMSRGLRRHALRNPIMTQERPPRRSMRGTCSHTSPTVHGAHDVLQKLHKAEVARARAPHRRTKDEVEEGTLVWPWASASSPQPHSCARPQVVADRTDCGTCSGNQGNYPGTRESVGQGHRQHRPHASCCQKWHRASDEGAGTTGEGVEKSPGRLRRVTGV